METIVSQALDEISTTGEVRIVYRDFPLRNIHRNAQSSSQAAQAAALQGKFWEMHERIFERVSEWENAANPQPIFDMYAQELGLDVAKFSQDYQSKFVRAKVEHEYQSGLLYRVGATPTVFLAGKKVTFATSEELVKLILKNE
jgi:protein-disulfide isomerase